MMYDYTESDYLLLPADASEHPAYAAFVQEIRGWPRGPELDQAWALYRAGWEARSKREMEYAVLRAERCALEEP